MLIKIFAGSARLSWGRESRDPLRPKHSGKRGFGMLCAFLIPFPQPLLVCAHRERSCANQNNSLAANCRVRGEFCWLEITPAPAEPMEVLGRPNHG